MTQKDNVKQLIGKSLNAYNNKVLQQIDKIEKKNKQQNHKISMLTNELDNDYLTKSEEGSVISLEHSKEGMVYIDSLEGNTLVNYCTDGSKELTLNGDIDLEGTFVTTTEGVDNGLVDVSCEGNTLVNIANDKTVSGTRRNGNIIITPTKLYSQFSVTHSELMSKLNTTYTIRIEVLSNTSTVPLVANKYNGTFNGWNGIEVGFTGEKIFTYTTGSEYQYNRWFWVENNVVGEGEIEIRLTILEGDWTDKEIPPYFEGMKSVGQDDENGHKIEILSQNKNLCTVSSYSGVCHNKIESNIPCKKNTVYTLTFKDESDLNQSGNRGITLITHKTKTDKNDHGNIYTYAMNEGGKEYTFRKSGFTFNTSDCCYISLTSNNMSSVPNLIIKEIQIEEGSQTSYSPQMFNKKEILLNEPLRGINDTIKDRFVKIGNKCFIERNCKVQTLNGSEGWRISDGGTQFICNQHRTDALGATNIPIICDKINVTTHQILDNGEGYGINLSYYLRINLRDCDAKNGATVEQFIQKLQANPVTIIYPLKTPTYEPLEINPELFCYNDTTHISNNSIIPCNMKVQNSGYNAIIKPSTLYTVALDTNKSGTIGMNLGGVKGTTTNNVLTLTTPATLTDDSLRLHGKGIKGSKVRLLEGDKTNWIPSHFEGMKSCFEDKVQDDRSYGIEIVSNNENLFDINKRINKSSKYWWVIPKLKANKMSFKFNTSIPYIEFYESNIDNIYNIYTNWTVNSTFTNVSQGTTVAYKTDKPYVIMAFDLATAPSEEVMKSLQVVDGDKIPTDYTPQIANKIQFSSIEPLRSVEHTKDRFIFKDNKLMIERNVGKVSIPSNFSVTVHRGSNEYYNSHSCGCYINTNIGNLIKTTNNVKEVVCKRFGYKYSIWGNGNYSEGICNIGGHGDGRIAMRIHNSLTGIVGTDSAEECSRKITNYLKANPFEVYYKLKEPTYEEIPFELQKIILEGYENGTLFFDTNIPPTSTITYAGVTPIVKSVRLNKTEVSNNTNDINDNIIPYLMDMDYRVVCLQLESNVEGISMAKLFGGVYEMLKRDILSKRLTKEEYGYRLTDYFNAGKLTEEQVRELEDLR